MKLNKIIALLIYLCALMPLSAMATEAGVSKPLAEHRAAHIKDVQYTLIFDLPDDVAKPVKGYEVMEFIWNSEDDLVLDFQGSASQFNGICLINGKSKEHHVEFANEHIIIPRKLLKKGYNSIYLTFISGNKSLNRSQDYLYTLFVPDHARSVFPCIDQPDVKALFKLTLEMPTDWRAISNGGLMKSTLEGTRKKLEFATTPLLPTYLFSFTAGRFNQEVATRDGRTIQALHRETDPAKIAQLQTVFDQIATSLRWLEEYTDMKYPFQKFGFVVLPGYQFGGMEHPGAIQFSDRSIFLGSNPTQDEELKRLELVAHETAHMWFGDLVTMRWFDDVWTKEVFANFMASKIARVQFPNIDHNLNFLKTYQASAMHTDRTNGSHPIQQPLDNLDRASLLYGNIIYDKAPVMMRMLEEVMGERWFRNGIRKYLKRDAFGNATWDDLVEILSHEDPNAHIKEFSNVWVKQQGMPIIETSVEGSRLVVRQTDPLGRGLVWNQKFDVMLGNDFGPSNTITVSMHEPTVSIPLARRPDFIIPNYSGHGYGRFTLPPDYTKLLIKRLICTTSDVNRYALALTLYDNYLMGRLDNTYFSEVYRTLEKEHNPLIISTLCNHLAKVAFDQPKEDRTTMELFFMDLLKTTQQPATRQHLLRSLTATAQSQMVNDFLYDIWEKQSEPLLSERDYMDMAYHLAIVKPLRWGEIINRQRMRLKNADLIREFEFVSRACTDDPDLQRLLFNSLLRKENRTVEPWAARTLALLSCNAREPQNNEYINPALNALEDIQRTGDIFFPANWVSALLSQHKSNEARRMVEDWIQLHPYYPPSLMNKVKENAYYLLLRKQ